MGESPNFTRESAIEEYSFEYRHLNRKMLKIFLKNLNETNKNGLNFYRFLLTQNEEVFIARKLKVVRHYAHLLYRNTALQENLCI